MRNDIECILVYYRVLLRCYLMKQRWIAGAEGGAMRWMRSHPPQSREVPFFVDQRFGKLELGTPLKNHYDQHSAYAANQVNNANFQLYFYFSSSLLLAACFHIIVPSKRIKCILRQPNFQKFPHFLLEARTPGACLVPLVVE